jgi:hypothetical protein
MPAGTIVPPDGVGEAALAADRDGGTLRNDDVVARVTGE